MHASSVCVFCFYVHTADRRFENADLGALVRGFDHAGFFLDADDFADDAADRGDLIANRQIVAHVVLLLLLLFLRADHKEIHRNQYHNDR